MSEKSFKAASFIPENVHPVRDAKLLIWKSSVYATNPLVLHVTDGTRAPEIKIFGTFRRMRPTPPLLFVMEMTGNDWLAFQPFLQKSTIFSSLFFFYDTH